MAIDRVKPGGWGYKTKLSSTEINDLDVRGTHAVDKRAGETDTVESDLTFEGRCDFMGQTHFENEVSMSSLEVEAYAAVGGSLLVGGELFIRDPAIKFSPTRTARIMSNCADNLSKGEFLDPVFFVPARYAGYLNACVQMVPGDSDGSGVVYQLMPHVHRFPGSRIISVTLGHRSGQEATANPPTGVNRPAFRLSQANGGVPQVITALTDWIPWSAIGTTNFAHTSATVDRVIDPSRRYFIEHRLEKTSFKYNAIMYAFVQIENIGAYSIIEESI